MRRGKGFKAMKELALPREVAARALGSLCVKTLYFFFFFFVWMLVAFIVWERKIAKGTCDGVWVDNWNSEAGCVSASFSYKLFLNKHVLKMSSLFLF